MCGTNPELMVILSYHLQLQGEHKDPSSLDIQRGKIQEFLKNKSCSKSHIIMCKTNLTFVLQTFLYLASLNVKTQGVLMLTLEL